MSIQMQPEMGVAFFLANRGALAQERRGRGQGGHGPP